MRIVQESIGHRPRKDDAEVRRAEATQTVQRQRRDGDAARRRLAGRVEAQGANSRRGQRGSRHQRDSKVADAVPVGLDHRHFDNDFRFAAIKFADHLLGSRHAGGCVADDDGVRVRVIHDPLKAQDLLQRRRDGRAVGGLERVPEIDGLQDFVFIVPAVVRGILNDQDGVRGDGLPKSLRLEHHHLQGFLNLDVRQVN